MFYVYILEAVQTKRFYIGYSENPERRLAEHNSGKVKSTRAFRPWTKVYTEAFGTEKEAIRREKQLKDMKSRSFLKALIKSSEVR